MRVPVVVAVLDGVEVLVSVLVSEGVAVLVGMLVAVAVEVGVGVGLGVSDGVLLGVSEGVRVVVAWVWGKSHAMQTRQSSTTAFMFKKHTPL